MKKIILASASPRRRELLTQLGVEFEVIPSEGDEIITKQDPAEVVEELSQQKAGEVAGKIAETLIDASVIGADTIVFHSGHILGKPSEKEDARKMLEGIQGDVHSVFTGVTVVEVEKGKEIKKHTFSCETKVHVYPMTDQEIEDYLTAKEISGIGEKEEDRKCGWEGKAGGYGIQDPFGKKYISHIEGDYYNVVGLPVSSLWQLLKNLV